MNILNKLLKTKWGIMSVIGVAVLILISIFVFSNGNGGERVRVERRDLAQEVVVSGKAQAVSEINLGFANTGKVSAIYAQSGDSVSAGEVLAELDYGVLQADLAEAFSQARQEEAKLMELSGGSPEDISLAEVSLTKSQQSLSQAYSNLVSEIRSAIDVADDAIKSDTGALFEDGSTSFGTTISVGSAKYYVTGSFEENREINTAKKEAQKAIEEVTDSINNLGEQDILVISEKAGNALKTTRDMLASISTTLNTLSFDNATAESTLDGFRTSVSNARTSVSTALSSLISAETSYLNAQNDTLISGQELTTTESGARSEVIIGQQAVVDQAYARVSRIKSEIQGSQIISPIDGVLVKTDIEIGDVVNANGIVMTVFSEEGLEIEANIPEVHVSKVQVGNKVDIEFDAFPGEIFTGLVSYIEQAETVIDGVANYKTTVLIQDNDPRLRSGLTANLVIVGDSLLNTLTLPGYALVKENGITSVRLITEDGIEIREVETGFRGTDGYLEILSGVKEGDLVELPE